MRGLVSSRTIDLGQKWLAVEKSGQVREKQVAAGVVAAFVTTSEMRSQDDVGKAPKRRIGGERLILEYIKRSASQMFGL